MIDLEKAAKERADKFFENETKRHLFTISELILISASIAFFLFMFVGTAADHKKKETVKEDKIVELLGYKYFQVDGIDYETSLITSIDYNTDFSNNNFVITYDDGKAIIRFRADEYTSHN